MKPQILHQFRQPSPRPPAAVAYLFTALAFAPLLVLLGLLASLGINLNVSTLLLPALQDAGAGVDVGSSY